MTSALATPTPTRKASSEDWPDATVIAARFARWEAGDRGSAEGQLLGFRDGGAAAGRERLAGELLVQR